MMPSAGEANAITPYRQRGAAPRLAGPADSSCGIDRDASDASLTLSVVVLSWNRRAALRETLQRLGQEASPPPEVIVVDNGSTDGSADMVRVEFPGVRLVALPHNVGIEGLNVGLRTAQGTVVVLLDDDSYPLPGALPLLTEAFRRDPALGIAACQIVSPSGQPAEAWLSGTPPGASVPTFIGCGAGIRRTAAARVGFFDRAFFLYGNELDLAARVMDAGYAVRYFPQIRFVHAVSPVNRTSFRREYYGIRNLLWTLWKYFPRGQALRLAARAAAGTLGYRMLRGNVRGALAVLRGICAAFRPPREALRRQPLTEDTRRRLLTHIDQWYPPLWPWLRAHVRRTVRQDG